LEAADMVISPVPDVLYIPAQLAQGDPQTARVLLTELQETGHPRRVPYLRVWRIGFKGERSQPVAISQRQLSQLKDKVTEPDIKRPFRARAVHDLHPGGFFI